MIPLVDRALEALARTFDIPQSRAAALLMALGGIALGYLLYKGLHWLRKTVAARTSTDVDEIVLDTVAAPAAWTIAFVAGVAGARLLYPGPELTDSFQRVLLSGILVIWGTALARLVRAAIARAAGSGKRRAMPLLNRLVNFAVGVVIFLTVFAVWDVNVTPLLAGAGLIGIALALAAQDTLRNFFAGIAIYVDRPYGIGDVVVLEQGTSSELRGTVTDVGLRSTRVLTRDDVLVTVPNGIIANGRVVNESGQGAQYRVHVPVKVALDADLDLVERILVGIGAGHPRVLGDPAPRARVRSFEDYSIKVELLVWIRDPGDRGLVVHDLAKAVQAEFRAAGIVIPLPQREVRMRTSDDDV